jgi:outer membrane protein assembly factor BamB
MRYVCLVAVLLLAASVRAQDGVAVYKAHCASCHDSGAVRVPPKSALSAISIPQMLAALESGPMKTVGDMLTPQERYAVVLYLSAGAGAAALKPMPLPASAYCATGAKPFRFSASGPSWAGWSTDAANSRFQNAEGAGLAPTDVPKLKLKWAFALGDETNARSQPAVAGGRLFFAAQGAVYSVDATSGCIHWTTNIDGVRSAVVIGKTGRGNHAAVFFGAGQDAYALDASTGKQFWKTQVAEHFASFITAAPLLHKGVLYFGVSSFEEVLPPPAGKDFDFGQPPILVSLANGRRELVIGQKSGVATAIDPDKQGAILWQTRVGTGGALGGSEWGSAADGQNIYVAVSDIGFRGVVMDKTAAQGYRLVPNPKQGGGLFALDLKTGQKAWSAAPADVCGDRTACSPAQSQAVTAIPGVVFSGSVDGHIRAYSAADGKALWDFDTAREYTAVNGRPARGGSLDGPGPVIAEGMVFVSSGYGQWGGMPGNVLLTFSVDGK